MNLNHPLSCLIFNTQRAARALSRGFEASVKELGMSAPQFTTLSLLDGFGELTVGRLADLLGTDRTTLSRNLDVMARKGWIEEVASTDQRQRAWRLTLAGKDGLGQALELWQAFQKQAVGRIGEQSAQDLLVTLKGLSDL